MAKLNIQMQGRQEMKGSDRNIRYLGSGYSAEDLSSSEFVEFPHQETWLTVLESFNPFGWIAKSYAKSLAYRIESRRLEAEVRLAEVEREAEVTNSKIEKIYRLRMEELLQRRVAHEKLYDTVQKEQENLHIERMTVLRIAEHASERALSDDITREERMLFKEMTMELMSQIPAFGERADQTMQRLVQALPPVNIPDRMLTEGRK